ncbi:methyltransferase domain-containing protein [Mariniluteicoccus endophyticus]
MIADVADLLICPACSGDLALDARTLGCPAGHRYDLARQGHVNLLGHAAPRHADTAAMVAARVGFLSRGHYRPVDDALVAAVGPAEVVVEAGAGPGLHLEPVITATGGRGVAGDVSAYACRRAARLPRIGAVVADTWAGLPIRSGVADAVLAVFAPRNMAEFRRLLAPGGRVVVVTPRAEHLASLRAELGLLDVEADKLERLDLSAEGHLELRSRDAVVADLDLSAEDVRDLVMMGPNAFHRDGEATWHPTRTRLAVDVSVYA